MSILRLATDAEKKMIDLKTYAEWGEKLTLAQFQKREEFLRATVWAKRSMQTWVWVDLHDEVLSSLEVYWMQTTQDRFEVAAIASVFTEPSKRKKGYALALHRALIKRLSDEKKNLAGFLLFSEIGKSFYERLGYRVIDSFERVFIPQDFSKLDFSSVRKIDDKEFAHFWNVSAYSKLVRLRHDFSIFASFEQFQWHWARESFYSHELARPQSQWQMVSVGEGQSGLERAFALFTINYKKNILEVLFFYSKSTLELQRLISFISHHAKQLQLTEVVIWESEHFINWQLLGSYAERRERSSSLAMYLTVDDKKFSSISNIMRCHWV